LPSFVAVSLKMTKLCCFDKTTPPPFLSVESHPADHLGRAATRTHKQVGDKLHQALDCLHGYGCQWWSCWASTITLSISKSASSSHHQQTGSFQTPTTTSKDNTQNAEKWERCLGWNSILL